MDNNNNNNLMPMHLKRKKKGLFGSSPAPSKKSTTPSVGNAPSPGASNASGGKPRTAPAARTASSPNTANTAPAARSAPSATSARTVPSANTANTATPAKTTPSASTVPSRSVPARPASENRVPATETASNGGKKPSVLRSVLKWTGRVAAVLFTAVGMLALTLVIAIKLICSDISPAAKSTFVTTMLETGELKFVASLFVSSDEIQRIVDANTMESLDAEVDSSLISIGGGGQISDGTDPENTDPIEVIEISGRTFYGTLLIVKDPSRISLASIYPWRNTGDTLDQLVENADAVAGINGGLYNSGGNSGGRPYGIVVANGEIQLNEPQSWPGLVIIGFDEDNILQIIPVGDMNEAETEALIKERRIRDAVTFQEEASDKNNHFVQLIINGEERELNGAGSGLNPRTCIGQRADGAVLMLVTDGRGKSGHLGASASDLIGVMSEYGAVNAANLDGGSSSCMYYEGEYLMDSVTFYQANSSWKMPVAFVVSKE